MKRIIFGAIALASVANICAMEKSDKTVETHGLYELFVTKTEIGLEEIKTGELVAMSITPEGGIDRTKNPRCALVPGRFSGRPEERCRELANMLMHILSEMSKRSRESDE